MRRARFAAVCLLALVGISPMSAGAQVRLDKLEWQAAVKAKGPRAVYEAVEGAVLSGPKATGKLRVRLVLTNPGAKAVEGILLRYSVSARLIPRTGGPGVWAVPFMLEEKRVPKLGAGQTMDVPLEPSLLPLYLRRLARTDFSPERFKLEVMLDPRTGEATPLQLLQSELKVTR